LAGQSGLSLRFACPASGSNRGYTEVITFTVYRQGDRSLADYQVGLRVYGSDISREEEALFGKVVDAFRFEK
jgi:hypothetical protein